MSVCKVIAGSLTEKERRGNGNKYIERRNGKGKRGGWKRRWTEHKEKQENKNEGMELSHVEIAAPLCSVFTVQQRRPRTKQSTAMPGLTDRHGVRNQVESDIPARFLALLQPSELTDPSLYPLTLTDRISAISGKEDEGRRLWKKAWGFNLFPMFISPPGDKPCAIKNISCSRCLAARPHL
ncbi:unnamed protein product [Pleuronectes platessa]|uniref:Uncharacterized protein n=1 Tax=Pleuronectes platessa TaxID=8262 RepID=A0A9N7U1H7_PLEPL|nr:unnamed protein product [Pleuronectes platessa]